MKSITFILIAAALALTSCGKKGDKPQDEGAGTEQGSPTVENPTLKIIFVPNSKLDETRLGGRFEENAIYWTNPVNNTKEGPRGVNTLTGPALEVQGVQLTTAEKKATLVTAYRVFKVPQNKKFVEVKIVANQTYNNWVDRQPSRYMAGITTSFVKDGQEVEGKRFSLPRNKEHETYTVDCEVPMEAQQMHLKIAADNAITFQILDMQVKFR